VAAEEADRPHRARPRRAKAGRSSKLTRDFYGSALEAAERIALEQAAEVEGLDEEIAVLRVKLRDVLQRQPEDLPLMLRGIELLVKAVSARYRLSKEAEGDLSESIAGVVRGVGGLLMPEAFEHEHGA
jgi:hypothetical protein